MKPPPEVCANKNTHIAEYIVLLFYYFYCIIRLEKKQEKTGSIRRKIMKKGISVWSFAGGSLEEKFKLAKKAGFDGVEVALDEKGELSLGSSDAQILKIKDLADKAGVSLYSVASGLYWSYSLTANDKNVREKAKSIVKKQLEAAKILGCDTILVVPGMVGADFIPGCEVVEYDAAYDRALSAMRELAPYAEECGVTIGVENVWNKFLLSPLEMRDLSTMPGAALLARIST
jgi:hexulose-6-phosphate isomerase